MITCGINIELKSIRFLLQMSILHDTAQKICDCCFHEENGGPEEQRKPKLVHKRFLQVNVVVITNNMLQ